MAQVRAGTLSLEDIDEDELRATIEEDGWGELANDLAVRDDDFTHRAYSPEDAQRVMRRIRALDSEPATDSLVSKIVASGEIWKITEAVLERLLQKVREVAVEAVPTPPSEPAQALTSVRFVDVVGRLPGRSKQFPDRPGIWITSYASRLERTAGATVLIRLGRDEDSIQLFGIAPRFAASECESFRNAVSELADHVTYWVLRDERDVPPVELFEIDPDGIVLFFSGPGGALDPQQTKVALQREETNVCERVRLWREATSRPGKERPPIDLIHVVEDRGVAHAMCDTIETITGITPRMADKSYLEDIVIPPPETVHFQDSPAPTLREVIRLIREARDHERSQTGR
jgi:hypothetical protein